MLQGKVLVVGNWRSEIHEDAISDAFEDLNCQVIRFKWNSYFTNKNKGILWRIYSRIEYHVSFGLIVSRVNKDLINIAINNYPDALFIYRPILISRRTINKIKSKCPNTIISAYNNDDPFSSRYNWQYWFRFRRAIASYDVIFSYRPANIDNYKQLGAKAVELLPPWFIKSKNYPIKLDPDESPKYKSDIVFIGHYENDQRVDIIRQLVKAGFDVALYGPEWNKVILNDDILKIFYPVKYLSGDEYNKALCGSKMALVIYSSLNNDVYTRRCFEIPATKTMMIAQRTDEMLALYEEDHECVYFDDVGELIEKVGLYISNESMRNKIAKGGYNRAVRSGYDVIGRASKILKTLSIR